MDINKQGMFIIIHYLYGGEDRGRRPSVLKRNTMTNYAVLREFGDGITQAELDEAVARSNESTESMREDGHAISYLGSEVFVNEAGSIVATMCRYDAESKRDMLEQSERGGLPVSGVFLRGKAVDATAPRAGVGMKAA